MISMTMSQNQNRQRRTIFIENIKAQFRTSQKKNKFPRTKKNSLTQPNFSSIYIVCILNEYKIYACICKRSYGWILVWQYGCGGREGLLSGVGWGVCVVGVDREEDYLGNEDGMGFSLICLTQRVFLEQFEGFLDKYIFVCKRYYFHIQGYKKFFLFIQFFKKDMSIQNPETSLKEAPSFILNYPLSQNLIQLCQKVGRQIQPMLANPDTRMIQVVVDFEIKLTDLKELKEKIQESILASRKVTGKNCVFLIGKTGAGKSTTLHFIAGKKLLAETIDKIQMQNDEKEQDEEQEDQEEDQQQDSPGKTKVQDQSENVKPFILVAEQKIQGFDIGHQQKSQTKIINTLDVGDLVIVDTAGLMDSNGAIYDIANAIGLQKAFCEAGKLKFLLVIAQNTLQQGRGVALIQLLSEIVGFAPKITQDLLLPAISIIISKSKTHIDGVVDLLKKIAKETKIEDSKVKKIIEQAGKKLNKKKSPINFVKLGKKSIMTNSEEGQNWKNSLIVSKSIQNPRQWFSISMKQKSKSFLQAIMAQLIRQIKNLTKKHYYRQIKAYLDQAAYLRKFIGIQEIKKGYEDCIQQINGSLDIFAKQYQMNLNNYSSETGELSDEAIQGLKQDLFFIREADYLRKQQNYGIKGDANYEKFGRNLIQKMVSIIQYIKRNLMKFDEMYSMVIKVKKIYFNFGKQIKQIDSIYRNFVEELSNQITKNIRSITSSVQIGDYQSCASPYNIIVSTKSIFQKVFKINLSSAQCQIIKLLKQSLIYRFKSTIKQKISKITQSSVDSLKTQYESWCKVFSSIFLKKTIGEEVINNMKKEVNEEINNFLQKQQKQIKEKIGQKNFSGLGVPILTYKAVRQIDQQFASKTSEWYFQLIAQLNYDVTNDSKQVFEFSIKKIKLGIINEQQIYNLKQKLYKIKELTWLSQVLGKDSIVMILSKVQTVLQNSVKNLLYELPNLIQIEMNQMEESLGNSFDLDGSSQIEFSLKTSRISSIRPVTNKFCRVNNTLTFFKSVSEINNNLQKLFQDAKNQIQSIVNQKSSYLINLTKEDKTELIWQSQIGIFLLRLSFLKNIKLSPLKIIENSIQTTCNFVQNLISNLMKQLKILSLKDTENILKTSSKLINLFENLQISISVLKSKKINLIQKRKQFNKTLQQKFEDFYQEFDLDLKQNKLEQSKKILQILKIYKTSEINDEMDNNPKESLIKLTERYEKYITDIPNQAHRLFQDLKLQQLIGLLEDYKKTKSQFQYKKIINEICHKIQKEYQSIVDDLSTTSNGDLSSFQRMNKNLKRFIAYSRIEQIIESSIKYKEKRAMIAKDIRNFFENTQQTIMKNIQTLRFKNLKAQVEKFNRINTVLLMGVYDQEFRVPSYDIKKQKLNKKIEDIIQSKMQIGQFSSSLKKLEKLKILDEEFQTDNSQIFYQKIKESIESICEKSIQKAEKTEKIQDIDKIISEIKKLKTDMSEAKKKMQFVEIMEKIKETEERLQSFANTFIHNSRYNKEYLQRLKRNQQTKFKQTKAQLNHQFQNEAKKVEDALSKSDYTRTFNSVKSLDKFAQIEIYIVHSIYETPSKFKLSIQNKIKKQNDDLHKKVLKQFKDRKINDLPTIKKFMNLQISSQGKINSEKLQDFHFGVVEYLKYVIPQIPASASVNVQHQRLKVLRKQKQLLQTLKNYVSDLQQVYTISDKSQIANFLANVVLAEQFEKNLDDYIRSLPIAIKQLWDKYQYRDISNKLGEVKKVGTSEFGEAFLRLSQLVKKFINDKGTQIRININKQKFDDVNESLNKITQAENQMKGILGLEEKKMQHKKIVDEVVVKLQKQIVAVAQKNISKKDANQVLGKIVQLRKWINQIPVLQTKVDEKVSGLLMKAKKQNLTAVLVAAAQKIVNDPKSDNKDAAVYKELMFKYSKQLAIPRILPKLRMTISDAIEKFSGQKQDSINKVQLRRVYDIYNEQYQKQKQRYIAEGSTQLIGENLKSIKDRILSLMKQIQDKQSDKKCIRQNIPRILANIFVFWSIKKSAQSFYEAREMGKQANDYLLQPHPIQVLSILRFIGCDDQGNILSSLKQLIGVNISSLDNHIMQIKTGEGKSVILGSMSILLALMGHKVDCVCYSSYLSQRDYEDFEVIFKQLEVVDRISYGTFNQIAQKIINEQCDIRNLADSIFMPKSVKRKEEKAKKYGSRVLLVDEIDTFFSRDFYGETYNPVTLLKSNQVNEIIDIIWNNKELNSQDIKKGYTDSASYKKIAEEYKDCIQRINTQLFFMAKDVKLYNSRDYVVQNGKIGYKQLDGISFNSVYGYQTMFAYIYESQPERGNVTKQDVSQFKGISITCGQYSYAEIINNFDKIFGVTGTLQSLSKFQSQILQRYKIKKKTYAPSVYGNSLRKQSPILIQTDKNSHHQMIATKIQQDLKQQRATLVFFQNELELENFKNSEYASRFSDKIKVVTEKTPNRAHHIKKATSSNTVTLFTAPFGRGTDFVIFDTIVEKLGINVIQTFLSEQQSQEIQIKGRTARQGKQGTYQLILNLAKLQSKYKINMEMIKKAEQSADDSKGNLLHKYRVKYLEEVNKERQKQVERSKQIHIKSTEMKEKMLDNKISRNEEFFFKNCTNNVGEKARIMCMIDSTGSMGGTINQVKGKVMDMIDSLASKYPGQFQIQLMFYYGIDAYSSQRALGTWCYTNKIHCSGWSSDTNLLRKFMTTVTASGGSSHEAIELGLHHLLLAFGEVGVTKGILIGDDGLACNSTSNMVYHVHPEDKHRYKGRQTTNIVQTLQIGDLLTKLKGSGISVDTYPIGGGRTYTTFQHISNFTGGKSTNFDPNKDNLSAQIETTITQCIVMRK